MLGTNGGGFFNANSAHPFENPNADHQPAPDVADLRDRRGADLHVRPHGRRSAAGLGDLRRHGRPVPRRRCRRPTGPKQAGNPAFAALHIDQAPSALQAGGNMEGKEVRFGIANSALFADRHDGRLVRRGQLMHDSFMPLGGLVPLVNIMLGEIIFGGVGSGLYGMLLFAILAVFIAGLMVGRTPEYLGKKIEAKEVKMAMLAILILPLSILGFTGARRRSCPPVSAGPANHRAARLQRDPLCLHLGDRQQRQRLCRHHRQYAVLQHDDRARDVDRPVPDDRADAGDRRLAGREEDRAGLGRHLPDASAAVCRPAGRRDPDRRRPDLLPGARARPDRRALRDARPARSTDRDQASLTEARR